MYQFKILLSSTITILFNLFIISKLYALGINDLKIKKLQDFEYAWGMDLIDNENLLVSEKKGILYIYNFLTGKIVGKETYNDVLSKRQGGLLDIIFVKDKEKNYVFSCYQNLNSDLIVARHELKNFKFLNKKIIFLQNNSWVIFIQMFSINRNISYIKYLNVFLCFIFLWITF